MDDPTRILRAVRFEQASNFSIDKRTMELLLEARPLVERVSGDRLRHELNHILVSSTASKIMHRLQSLEMLQTIHPALYWDEWLTSKQHLLENLEPDPIWLLDEWDDPLIFKRNLAYVLWFMRLPESNLQQVVNRLKLSLGLSKDVQTANRLFQDRDLI